MRMDNEAAILQEVSEILPKALEFRKEIHQNPELGYHEYETTDKIVGMLETEGLDVERFSNITGAVTYINNHCEKTIAVRVDIDALPIVENTGAIFASKNHGVMHACGHDMHTAMGMALALVLNRLKDMLNVNVKIIFQPAEECSPHGGAKHLIEEGVLSNPRVDTIYGFHVWPDLKVGEIGVKPGPLMAASDRFKITIKGKKSHAALPHKGTDAIQIAYNVIDIINSTIKKKIEPFEPNVISVGKINSDGGHNIVCDYVELEGTIRTLNTKTRERVHSDMIILIEQMAKICGGEAFVDIQKGYNTVVNDRYTTQQFIDYCTLTLGEDKVKTGMNSSLVAEDFSAYSELIPATYFWLGCESENPLHSDQFLVKETTMEFGLKLMSSFLINMTYVKSTV